MAKKFVLLMLCVTIGISEVPTGLQVGLSIQALQDLENALYPEVEANIKSIKIGDIEDKIPVGLFSVKIDVTNILLTDFTFNADTTYIATSPPNDVTISFTNITGTITFDWRYKYLIGGSHGTGECFIEEFNGEFKLAMEDKNGKPHLRSVSDTLSIGVLKLKLKGSILSEIADWFIFVFKGSVKNILIEQISAAYKDSLIGGFNREFEKMPLLYKIGGDVEVNYTLSKPPRCTASSTQFDLAGTFEYVKDPNPSPPVTAPVKIPSYNYNSYQYQISVTDYTVNTALYSIAKANDTIELKNDKLETTTTIDNLFPGTVNIFGPNKPCYTDCKFGKQPYIISTETETTEVNGWMELDCVFGVEDVEEIITNLHIPVNFTTDLYIKEWALKGTVKKLQTYDITDTDTDEGITVNDENLRDFFNTVNDLLISFLDNSILAKGVPLPKLLIANLDKSELVIKNQYFFIGVTPVWNIPSVLLENK